MQFNALSGVCATVRGAPGMPDLSGGVFYWGFPVHPVLIVIPAAALIFGPRLWVRQVMNQHNRRDGEVPMTAGELARQLLDHQQLYAVKVECTDIGDHYDHRDKTVRLNRAKIDRKTLTAVTTAAHEVAHALQDASGYGPFVWRIRLARAAQVTVEVGSLLLLAVPVTALVTRRPVPPVVVGSAAVSVLGAGVATQLAALPFVGRSRRAGAIAAAVVGPPMFAFEAMINSDRSSLSRRPAKSAVTPGWSRHRYMPVAAARAAV